MSKQYDYIVIGGGSAGSGTANRAAMYGAKVLLIEGGQVGGTCVNLGCVPKKIMWYGAQVSETLHKYSSGYGFEANNLSFNFTTLKASRMPLILSVMGSKRLMDLLVLLITILLK